MIKKTAICVLGLAILFLVGFWMAQNGTSDNVNNIEFIKSHCYNGKIIDMQNEVSVRSIDDIRWYYDEHNTIVIEYGKILLKYKTKDFVTPEVQEDLNSIFIQTKQHKETLELTLYFQGEELPEYVKR